MPFAVHLLSLITLFDAGTQKLLAPERVLAFLGVDSLEIFLVSKEGVIQLFLPYPPSAVKGTQRLAVGDGTSVQAQCFTGPRAPELVLPAGPRVPTTEPLKQEKALQGCILVTGLRGRGEYRSHGGDSITITIERLHFPTSGVLRSLPLKAQVWVYPP